MNIIFGREYVSRLDARYTVLELDTFNIQGQEVTAFCVVEQVPILDMPKVDSMKSLHQNLLENFRKGDWNYCEQALEHLKGFWNQELDTFYNSIGERIKAKGSSELTENWWIIEKDADQVT